VKVGAWLKGFEAILAVAGVVISAVALWGSQPWTANVLALGLVAIAMFAVVVAALATWTMSARESSSARGEAWRRHATDSLDTVLTLASITANQDRLESNVSPLQRASDACSEFAKAFSAVTGDDCRVTVKEAYSVKDGSNQILVRDLIRPSQRKHANGGDPAVVAENSDFFDVVIGGERRFFSNDLVDELRRGYRNSHWTPEKLKLWEQTGEYPYRSAIVWPIRARRDVGDRRSEWNVVGVLCIDSERADSFDSTYDIEIGESFAAALMCVWNAITTARHGGSLG